MTASIIQERIIKHDGDTWRIVQVGSVREGKAYVHLASTTRSRQQRNGKCPVQVCDWIDLDKLPA